MKTPNFASEYPKDSFPYKLALSVHQDKIRAILQSKQSDSFTTQDYIDLSNRNEFGCLALTGSSLPIEYARKALTDFGVVREVEPDVWALLY